MRKPALPDVVSGGRASSKRNMPRVLLVHWNEAEAKERSRKLDGDVELVTDVRDGASLLSRLKRRPPAAMIIDLSRLPSQGRDLALALGESKATRAIPIVFVDGDGDKLERVKTLLPDATYAIWRGIRGAVSRALRKPLAEPVVRNRMSGYAHKPLSEKLGVRPGSRVAMPGAPKGFPDALGVERARGRRDLTLWFVVSRTKLENDMARMARHAENGGLWILWPKKSGPRGGDLDPAAVRRAAKGAGLVDFKIASIDETWSGLRFTRKKS